MSTRTTTRTRTSTPAALTAVLLILFSASGMLAGTLVRVVGQTHFFQRPNTHLSGSTGAATPHIKASPTATATNTPYPARLLDVPFSLSEAISPSPAIVAPGQTITVTVTAQSQSGEPLAGLTCVIGDSEHGGVPLLQTWPPPAVTDGSGTATWKLRLPSTLAPGTYIVPISAKDAVYSAIQYRSVTIKNPGN